MAFAVKAFCEVPEKGFWWFRECQQLKLQPFIFSVGWRRYDELAWLVWLCSGWKFSLSMSTWLVVSQGQLPKGLLRLHRTGQHSTPNVPRRPRERRACVEI